MELTQIRYFVRTVQLGGLAKAAADVHVSISAVSKAISNLEDELNCKLFGRSGRHLQLTETGSVFLKRCRIP